MNSREWFSKAEFGFMSHFGLYSALDGDYHGEPCTEWVRFTHRIPMQEYHNLAKAFCPIYFNADEWVKVAQDAGMQYMVLTAKHHEGFAMYHSKVSKFNVVDATPFGRDIIGEMAESCYKNGMKFGVYYSQDLDWEEEGGGYRPTAVFENGPHNVWDFPVNRTPDFNAYFENKVKPQVTELLTQYGNLCLIWFDCPWTISKEQSTELYDLVKKLQPECLVNSRLGNGLGDYQSGGDNILDGKFQLPLREVPVTISGTRFWNFSRFDKEYKSAEQIIAERDDINGYGANYLLNIGPDHLGRLPAEAVRILSKIGEIDRSK